MVGRGGRAEQFGEDRFQGVGPNLIAFRREVEFVGRHAVEERAIGRGEAGVDIEVANGFSVGEAREVFVDAGDAGQHGRVVVARENRGENDFG